MSARPLIVRRGRGEVVLGDVPASPGRDGVRVTLTVDQAEAVAEAIRDEVRRIMDRPHRLAREK